MSFKGDTAAVNSVYTGANQDQIYLQGESLKKDNVSKKDFPFQHQESILTAEGNKRSSILTGTDGSP